MNERSESAASQGLQYAARVYGWHAGRSWAAPAPIRQTRPAPSLLRRLFQFA